MAISSFFFDAVLNDGVYDRVYNSGDFSNYLNLIVGSGVFPTPSTNLQVRAATPNAMSVVVGAGSGWIDGHKMISDSDATLSVDASDSVLNRIDYVIMYLDMTGRTMGLSVKKGSLAATPSEPTLTRNSSRKEYALAKIYVDHGITAITSAKIEDVRMSSSRCGYVQGLIQQVSTETMWQQQQAEFDQWFADVQQQLVTGIQFKKLEYILPSATGSQFVITDYIPTYSYVYDILEVYINGLHLTGGEYTKSGATITLTTPLTSSSTIDFIVYKSVSE